jgi:hypothetical protein
MQSGDISTYKQLTQFRDLKDFNNHFEQWMIDIKDKFTKGELVALKRLVRYSAKIQGVCYAKIQTIVASTHEHDGVGISRSTFERMLRKAKKVGLMQVINTKSKNGRQAHNVYVFQPYKSVTSGDSIKNEVPKVEKNDVPNKTINLSETSNNINNKRYSDDELDASFTNSKVPSEFVEYVSNFFDSAKVIEELHRIVQLQTRYLTYYSDSDRLNLAIRAFKQLIRAIKSRKKIKSLYGYYWGILDNLLDEEYSQIWFEAFENAG